MKNNKRAADAFAKLAEGLSVRQPEENTEVSGRGAKPQRPLD